MKFFHVPVTSFEDATRNFEQAGTAFLALLTPDGSSQWAWGTSTVTFTASQTSAAKVIATGLKSVKAAWTTANGSPGMIYRPLVNGGGAGNISVQAFYAVGVTTGTEAFSWLAVG